MPSFSLYSRLGAALFLIAFLSLAVSISAVDSTGGDFNVTPASISLNWSNTYFTNITLGAKDNLTLWILNRTTWIDSNYSQEGFYDGDPFNESKYYSGPEPACFHTGVPAPDLGNPLNVKNSTGIYTNSWINATNGASQNFTLIHYVLCPPGRYFGNLTISNSSVWNDTSASTANVTVLLDIPLATDNQLNATTGQALFGGSMPASAAAWHSYYFNTSNLTAAKAISLNMSWSNSSKDLDLFLFDGSGNLKAKSVRRTAFEELNYNYLPAGEVWEIRVFGNFSGTSEQYTIRSHFSTLNITNTTDNSTFTIIDLGTKNASQSEIVNITITNQGNLTPSVQEAQDIWHIDTFSGSGGPTNYTVLIPGFATNVTAWLNWTGTSNYTLKLFKPDGSLVGSSNDKQKTVNESGAGKLEFVETPSITSGLWKAGVINNSGTDTFTLTVKFQVASDSWVNSTYTTTTFNKTGIGNYTKDFQVNFTVPNTTLSGLYQGTLTYTGSKVEVPFQVNITTPVLLVNNTLNTGSLRLTDNIGFNRTGNQLNTSVLINNTGNQNLTFEGWSNSTSLNKGAFYLNFSYTYPSTITAGSSGQLDINVTVDTTKTNNSAGLYTGWIFLNDTDSHPYSGFNLTVEVNLTADLRVTITNLGAPGLGDNWINNITNPENLTAIINVYYLNNTEIPVPPTNVTPISLGNFSFYLQEPNGSKRVPASGYLTKSNFTTHLYESTAYKINLTGLPADLPGGFYTFYSNVVYSPNGYTLSGTGTSQVIVNNTGLKLAIVSSPDPWIYEAGNVTYVNVSVKNYGPKKATGKLYMTDCSYAHPSYEDQGANCYTAHSGANFTVAIDPNGTEPCWFQWKITSISNVDEDKSCYFSILATDGSFGNLTDAISMNVVNRAEDDGAVTGGPITCQTDINCPNGWYCKNSVCTQLSCTSEQYIDGHVCSDHNYSLEILGFDPIPEVLLGDSVTTKVNVNNTGSSGMTVKLNVTINDGITAAVTPASFTIGENENYTFTVNFTVSFTATTGNHSGTFTPWKSTGTATASTSENFTISVLPTAGRVAEVNVSHQEYLDKLENLTTRFNTVKISGLISPENLTTVEVLLEQSLNLSQDIEDALAVGNYIHAEALLRELNQTFDRLETELALLELEQQMKGGEFQGTLFVWGIAAVIIIAAVAFIIYLLLPPSGYRPGAGFKLKKKPRGAAEKLARIQEKMRQKKKKFKERAKAPKPAPKKEKFRYKYKAR